LALWNATGNIGIREFELFADDNNNFTDGCVNLLNNNTNTNTFEASQPSTPIFAQTFFFTSTETQYIHLNILNNHGGDFVSAGEVAFQQVPFEFGPIPGIIFMVAAGGINYFRRKGKKGGCR